MFSAITVDQLDPLLAVSRPSWWTDRKTLPPAFADQCAEMSQKPLIVHPDSSDAGMTECFQSNRPIALARDFVERPCCGKVDQRRQCRHCGGGFVYGYGGFYRATTLEDARLELRQLLSRMGGCSFVPEDDDLATLQREIVEARAVCKDGSWQAQYFCSLECMHSSMIMEPPVLW